MPGFGTPIGAITAFAGNTALPAIGKIIADEGWLLCDGASYAASKYPDLYNVIQTAHGGNAGNFNVPDLRSRWIRGRNGTAGSGLPVDPDVASRTFASAGGATGNNVGSLQGSATALPMNPWTLEAAGDHTHQLYHLSSTMHEAWSGSWISFARWNETRTLGAAGLHSHTLTGGDPQTAPINVSFVFVIKAKMV